MIYRHLLTFLHNFFLKTLMKVKMGESQAIDFVCSKGGSVSFLIEVVSWFMKCKQY